MRLRRALLPALLALAALVAPSAHAASAPRAFVLKGAWQWREEAAAPAPTQPGAPEESDPGDEPAGAVPAASSTPAATPSQTTPWQPTTVPSVFDGRALPNLYGGSVRSYRLSFTGPTTPRGFSWRFHFDEVRRGATIFLNGRKVGANRDPYTPFEVPASGLKPGQPNVLRVLVDGRKNPKMPEAWWNWIGIVRPVHLVPVGRAHITNLGTMSDVHCSGPATGCKASLLIDGNLERRDAKTIAPRLDVRLRAPGGRVTSKTFKLPKQRASKRRLQLSVPVPAPQLWAPDTPNLYNARITLRDGGVTQQLEQRQVGLRSVTVVGGMLRLNNRPIQLRGASIHEDMPGHGAALTPRDMDAIVAELKDLGANVTRSHYLLNDGLLRRFDRAGIMVWNQAPIWQRDRHGNLLAKPSERKRAWETVRRTVIGGRSHPAVITHSVGNELWSRPDERPNSTKPYMLTAQAEARKLDPTLPISIDINGRPGHPEQFTYHKFDMLGINQYYGWYSWVSNFDELPLFLQEMRDNYPDKALVMTEFGAEGREELADAPIERKGGYAFQAMHAARTLDVLNHAAMSGGIYWTLREFEITPGWTGGAGRRPAPFWPNTRHQKGLLTYTGQKKPVWQVVHDSYAQIPLYTPTPVPARSRAAQAARAAADGDMLPADVQRTERAVLDLHDAKAELAAKKAKARAAARKKLKSCKRAGPGWARIRAVRDPSQHSAYVRGAKTLWRDLEAAAQDAGSLAIYEPAFARFLKRFDPPLDDPLLRAGVASIAHRLDYERAATSFATCATFDKLTKPIRQFKPGVNADYQAGHLFQKLSRYATRKRQSAARKYWPSAQERALDAARARLVELGGDEGRATYFRYAYSLNG